MVFLLSNFRLPLHFFQVWVDGDSQMLNSLLGTIAVNLACKL